MTAAILLLILSPAAAPDAEAAVAVAVAVARVAAKPAGVPPVSAAVSPAAPTDAERWDRLRDRIGLLPVVVVVGDAPRPREVVAFGRFPSGFMGFADGVYDGVLAGGKPALRVREAPAPVPFAPPPGSGPGGFTQGIPARSAVWPSTSSPAPARGPAPIPTPALRVIRGGTDPGCLSG
jgi:hypothetical protein